MKIFSEELVERAVSELHIADLSQATIGDVLLVAQYLEKETGIPFIRMDQGSPGLPANQIGIEAEKAALDRGVGSQYLEVVEGKIAIADIMAAAREGKLEEVFGTGTAAVVSPVKELVWKGEHAYIGDGKIGPVTQKLYDTMTGMQWGKIPDTKGWIVPVEKKY